MLKFPKIQGPALNGVGKSEKLFGIDGVHLCRPYSEASSIRSLPHKGAFTKGVPHKGAFYGPCLVRALPYQWSFSEGGLLHIGPNGALSSPSRAFLIKAGLVARILKNEGVIII